MPVCLNYSFIQSMEYLEYPRQRVYEDIIGRHETPKPLQRNYINPAGDWMPIAKRGGASPVASAQPA